MVDIDDSLVEFIRYSALELSRKHSIPMPARFGWNRKRNNCGMCCYQKGGEIQLNVHFCKENDYCQIHETIIHEMAHLATPGDNHGPRWEALYKAMGGSGDRLHNFEHAVASATARAQQDRMLNK